MSNNRIFTDAELKEMGRHPKDLALEAIKNGDLAKAEEMVNKFHGANMAMHDLYLDWITNLMSYIYENYGVEKLDEAMTRVVKSYFIPLVEAMKDMDVRQKTEMSVSAFFGHGSPIHVEEDDEKVTYWMIPCGGGQGQVKAGAYQSRIYSPVEKNNITWNIPNLPIYCVHAPVQDRIGVEILGYLLWVYEPCAELSDPSANTERGCGISVYKDPNNIPESAYERIGLKKPAKIG